MRRARRTLQLLSAVGVLAALGAAGAAAQEPLPQELSAQPRVRSFASPFLPANHWAVEAARRLSTLGLAERDFGWGDGSLTQEAVARVLQHAMVVTRLRRRELAPLTMGYWERFKEEFPTTAAKIERREWLASQPVEGWASVGYSSATGRVFPVRSLDYTKENVAGPFPRPRLSEVDASATLNVTAWRYLAASLSPEHRDGDWNLGESYALASWWKLGIWGGRRAPAFGPGAGGGIVFNGTASFPGGGFNFVDPVRLPWVLRYLGPIRFETFLSQIDSSAAIRHPWVFGAHASISPHPRVLIGLTPAFMFSGDGRPPFTWRNFKEMFFSHGINITGQEFENGVTSAEFRVRPPVPFVPLVLYLEWGSEDNHGAWHLFPGTVAGAQVPAIPGLPALSVGVERAYFHGPCLDCKYYATWYRHYVYKDGWTLDREPIGHPLGGEGYEWLVYGRWDDPKNPLRLDAQLFRRYRGPFNIYSPAREGHSAGGELSTVYCARTDLDIVLTGSLEDGRGWTESSLFGGVRWIF